MKRILRNLKLGWVSFLLMLGACATQTLPPGGQTTESIVAACTSYTSTLHALTPFKAKLSASDILYVGKANTLVTPICSDPASYTTAGALQAVVTEAAQLSTILKPFKANGGKP